MLNLSHSQVIQVYRKEVLKMNVKMKMSKNGYRMWVMKNAKPKFGIVYHERGGMLLISYTSKAGNK